MIIFCNNLLPNNRTHGTPSDIGKVFKPIPVIERVIDVDVAPILSNVSTVSNIVIRVL